jgi:hypothetical protein
MAARDSVNQDGWTYLVVSPVRLEAGERFISSVVPSGAPLLTVLDDVRNRIVPGRVAVDGFPVNSHVGVIEERHSKPRSPVLVVELHHQSVSITARLGKRRVAHYIQIRKSGDSLCIADACAARAFQIEQHFRIRHDTEDELSTSLPGRKLFRPLESQKRSRSENSPALAASSPSDGVRARRLSPFATMTTTTTIRSSLVDKCLFFNSSITRRLRSDCKIKKLHEKDLRVPARSLYSGFGTRGCACLIGWRSLCACVMARPRRRRRPRLAPSCESLWSRLQASPEFPNCAPI